MKFRIWSEIEVGGERMRAGYDAPCDATRCRERTGILSYNRAHGHVVLDTDDGSAWLPFPFESREGLKTYLELLWGRGDPDFADGSLVSHILSQRGLDAFPEKMTDDEASWFSSPDVMKRLMQYGYVGFGR